MIFVQPKGRMGNQMFQIAAAHALSKENNDSFLCTENVQALSPHTIQQRIKLRNTIFRKIIFDSNRYTPSFLHTDEAYFSYKKIPYVDGLCLAGYYQSHKHFVHFEKDIKELFEPSQDMIDYVENNYRDLLQDNQTCAVHIRRGDYLKYKNHHHNLSLNYYKKAINEMGKDKRFIFFSDDINWCKSNFFNVSNNFINTGDDLLDFVIMSKMKNNIIANSSYGWWAAFLNDHENKKVICPTNWFGPDSAHLNTKDVFPESWLLLTD